MSERGERLVGMTREAVIETKRTITHDEARQIAHRFIHSHFRNDGGEERARISIPADTERDDDILLISYIAQQEKLLTALRTSHAADVAAIREACAKAVKDYAMRYRIAREIRNDLINAICAVQLPPGSP